VIVTTGRELEVASEHGLALSKCCCVDSISLLAVADLIEKCSLVR
jgi:hypothetical protein